MISLKPPVPRFLESLRIIPEVCVLQCTELRCGRYGGGVAGG